MKSVFRRSLTTVRTIKKNKDGKWYVCRKAFTGGWLKESKLFNHSTSAWAHLGKLTAKEQSK